MSQKLTDVLFKFYRNFYVKLFPDFICELGNVLNDCISVLDIGCGDDSPIKYFSNKFYYTDLKDVIYKTNLKSNISLVV